MGILYDATTFQKLFEDYKKPTALLENSLIIDHSQTQIIACVRHFSSCSETAQEVIFNTQNDLCGKCPLVLESAIQGRLMAPPPQKVVFDHYATISIGE
jgi:hypothetical protein